MMTLRVPPHLLAPLFATFLCGCMVGPDFERPDAPQLDSWSKGANLQIDSRTGFTTRTAETAAWWRVFKDPALNALVADAYSQNVELQAAGVRVYQARAQLGLARGELFPQDQQVKGGVRSIRWSTEDPFIRDLERVGLIDNHMTRVSAGFDAGWEIDIWGKIRRDVQSAKANYEANLASYDDALVTLTGDIAATYVTIRELQQLVAIAKRNAALQRKSANLTKLRLENGAASRLDVNEATVLLNNTLALIPSYQAELAQAYNAMSVLLSEPPGAIEKRLGPSAKLPRVPAAVAIGVPAGLLRRRPDIRYAEYLAAAQSAQIGVAKADLFPAFTITGAIGVRAADFSDLFTNNATTGFINPGFSWNFLNYGRIQNNVRIQDAKFQEALLNYENVVLTAYSEVETAIAAFLRSKQEAVYLRRSVTAARSAVTEVQAQYQDGTAAYNRVVDAQRSLLTSEERYLAAHANVLTNLVAIYKGLGGGWLPENVDGLISEKTRQQMAERTNWGNLLDPV
ncbi:NodT family efflux transporter outer membrane factor (OMF) lipoprotein [Roseibium hamelinense]|uniref:NodT family efflux transporter outer membrane factor (OMF) lipoprotein n=1 Tax=Roseibium hamelinense TaxID=150831 RepID=A0A562SKI1_9HYPH|nr:efflux transporter outer membrane subunit [Roseibium hamelinense]MTI43301.1 efflux transporter outer membrane subunit [Roseibium hamelinense]TWI81769.1 NodT family efflux transporter outer membrane factor (OMF) lipoprotein [Roseibium hamelinense]